MTTPKHPYNPGWSWGNAISIIAIVVSVTMTGLGVYVMMRIDAAVAEEKIVTLDKKVETTTQITNVRIEKLETKLDELSKSTEDMRVVQAVMRANIELFMRSQGLRPLDEEAVAPPKKRAKR